MGRHERRAKARHDRVAEFSKAAGASGYETSLRGINEHRPQDGRAINNWLLSEPTAKPTCFACREQFGAARRPGAFLTAVAIRAGPKAGVAVAGCCAECWATKAADEVEQAAFALLRKQLGAIT
jgi:hypothetical protein